MSSTDFFEDDLLDLLFTNVDLPNVGDATGLVKSSADGVFYISLHTATLNDTHTLQTQTEAAYSGGYARIGVARTTSGWTVASGTVDNDSAITFATATSSETETDFGIGFSASGAGELQIFGALSASLAVSNGVTPEFAAGALDISID